MKTFRIYPIKQSEIYNRSRDKRYWFDVSIYSDQKAFVKATGEKKAWACTRSVKYQALFDMFGNCIARKRKSGKRSKDNYLSEGKIGDIAFRLDKLTDEVIVHECVHAMFRTLHMFTDTVHLWAHEGHMIHAEEYMAFLVNEYVNQIKKSLSR